MKQAKKRLPESSEKSVSNLDEALRVLFERALEGDEASYRKFLEQIAGVLRGFLFRTMRADMRSAEKVEDLVQDVLIAIHRKRDLYKPGMPVIPWVRAIAKHRFIDSLRAEARRPQVTELTEQLEKNFVAEEIENDFDLESLMSCLDERQKKILKLAKIEEVPHAEIASRLGISVALVKVTVHRSLAAIRKSLNAKK